MPVRAAPESKNKLYEDQLQKSSADRLFSELPDEVRDRLSDIGIDSPEYETLSSLDTGRILAQIGSVAGENAASPLCSLTACIGIMLLCAVTEGFKVSAGDKKLEIVQNAVGSVCICTALIVPLSATVSRAAETLSGAAGFMLLYVPILAGLLISSGSQATGGSYYTAMMTAGNAVTLISSKILVPLMNVFLALSVTSSVSPKMKLGSLCDSVYKTGKWILTFVTSIFITVMSLNTIVTSSMDNVSKKALKFSVSSFVPVVGGVLSEAITTFSGSLELLRSGAGVFVIIASAMILLPALIECILWQMSLFVLNSAAEISGVSQMCGVFKSVSKAVGMLTAMMFCVLTVFIISTVVILLAGRKS